MLVVAVAVVVAVPAGLHADLVCVVDFEVHVVEWAVVPDVCGVAVPALAEETHFVDVLFNKLEVAFS